MKEELLYYTQYMGVTTRNVADRQTAYLIAVYQLHFTQPAMEKLWAAAQLPVEQRWMYFVDDQELHYGQTREGVAIGEITHETLHMR